MTRVIIEKGRAVGVECAKGRRRIVFKAQQEVVLSAGAIATPKLMMLSGLGPAEQIRRQGLTVHADIPGVGQNLQDHTEISLV